MSTKKITVKKTTTITKKLVISKTSSKLKKTKVPKIKPKPVKKVTKSKPKPKTIKKDTLDNITEKLKQLENSGNRAVQKGPKSQSKHGDKVLRRFARKK